MRSTLGFNGAGEEVATPFERQDSSMMANFARADCLVIRPPEAPPIKKGERVRILKLRLGPVSL